MNIPNSEKETPSKEIKFNLPFPELDLNKYTGKLDRALPSQCNNLIIEHAHI